MCLGVGQAPLAAQTWNSAAALALRAAAEQRRAVDAAGAAGGWHARAHGLVTYQVQAGDAFGGVPRLVTADELRVEVYGRGPGRSKQTITAWRRERYFPSQLIYHRDHLGIVTDGYGDRIRLGDGDEVRDALHPLARGADTVYDFALADSLSVSSPAGTVTVYELLVRPRSADAALIAGTLYIDAANAALVRFRFTFTPASYRDATIEDITCTLEQLRAGAGVWVPYRQRLEIRRRGAWMDFPFRTIIRAQWEIEDVELLDQVPDSMFVGDMIAGPRRPQPDSGWARPLRDAVDALDPADASDEAALRAAAQQIAAGRLLARERVRLQGRAISDLVRFNRVQGLAVGAGISFPVTRDISLRPDLGVGFGNGRVTGGARVEVRTLLPVGIAFVAERRVRDFSDWPAASGVTNSLTALAGTDAGDYVELERAGVVATVPLRSSLALRVESWRERARSLAVDASPLTGTFRPNPALGTGPYTRFGIAMLRTEPSRERPVSWDGTLRAEYGDGASSYGRIAGEAVVRRRTGPGELRLELRGGAGTDSLPAYRAFALGGRGTLVGEPFRAWAGRQMVWGRVSYGFPVGVPDLHVTSLLSMGRTMTVAPFVAGGATWNAPAALVGTASEGLRPVAGVMLEPVWGLLRIEIGAPLRGPDAGRPHLAVDVHPDWWGIL